MVRIGAQLRGELTKPLGRLLADASLIQGEAAGRRIISIGDVCTLRLLDEGIRPHLAVFDLRSMRKDLAPELKSRLASEFPEPERFSNPQGTLSEDIIAKAPALIRKGGAILIEGEEDLTALAFVLAAGRGDLIVYGQPEQGLVLVGYDPKLKKRIEGWLSAAPL